MAVYPGIRMVVVRAMKLCACRKGCKKAVKGKGLYALGHAPGSHVGRMPSILRRLRERFEGQQKVKKSTEIFIYQNRAIEKG